VVLAAINVSQDSQDIIDALKTLRDAGMKHFVARLTRGIEDPSEARECADACAFAEYHA
jgi:hypothetical protein